MTATRRLCFAWWPHRCFRCGGLIWLITYWHLDGFFGDGEHVSCYWDEC